MIVDKIWILDEWLCVNQVKSHDNCSKTDAFRFEVTYYTEGLATARRWADSCVDLS